MIQRLIRKLYGGLALEDPGELVLLFHTLLDLVQEDLSHVLQILFHRQDELGEVHLLLHELLDFLLDFRVLFIFGRRLLRSTLRFLLGLFKLQLFLP